jgi:hypothetical protein
MRGPSALVSAGKRSTMRARRYGAPPRSARWPGSPPRASLLRLPGNPPRAAPYRGWRRGAQPRLPRRCQPSREDPCAPGGPVISARGTNDGVGGQNRNKSVNYSKTQGNSENRTQGKNGRREYVRHLLYPEKTFVMVGLQYARKRPNSGPN